MNMNKYIIERKDAKTIFRFSLFKKETQILCESIQSIPFFSNPPTRFNSGIYFYSCSCKKLEEYLQDNNRQINYELTCQMIQQL